MVVDPAGTIIREEAHKRRIARAAVEPDCQRCGRRVTRARLEEPEEDVLVGGYIYVADVLELVYGSGRIYGSIPGIAFHAFSRLADVAGNFFVADSVPCVAYFRDEVCWCLYELGEDCGQQFCRDDRTETKRTHCGWKSKVNNVDLRCK